MFLPRFTDAFELPSGDWWVQCAGWAHVIEGAQPVQVISQGTTTDRMCWGATEIMRLVVEDDMLMRGRIVAIAYRLAQDVDRLIREGF